MKDWFDYYYMSFWLLMPDFVWRAFYLLDL